VQTGVPVYFCDPRRPWQRGSNENTNGLLRQYFPKRTEIAYFTQADLDGVAAELNGRPRRTLRWRSPSQALDESLR
jgi:transposase, IS30 family